MNLQLLNRYKVALRYIFREEKVEAFPLELVVELTNRCNMSCTICPRDKMERPIGDMDFSLFKKIVDELKGKTEMFDLCFAGESLLHKDVFEMIKYARQNNIKTFVQTNAMVLDRIMSEKLINSGLDLLVLSIDAVSEQVYNLIRRGGDFYKVVKNAEEFLKIKNLNGKKPYTIVQMVYTEYNKNEVEDFYHYWIKKGADAVRIKPFNSRAGLVSFGEIKKQELPCIRLWRGMAVFWDGKVVPCCMDYKGKYVLGDVSKEKILDIWNSEKMVYLRKLHTSGEVKNSELCKNCEGYKAGIVKTLGSVFFDAVTIRKLAPVWNKNGSRRLQPAMTFEIKKR